MSDTRFTASNGWYVEEDGRLFDDCDNLQCREGPIETSYIEYGAHKAQAERDAALGRWRSVEHPDWVVYPGKPDESLPFRYQECVVVDERDGNRLVYGTFITSCYSGEGKEVAREFFAAHPVPEPKPWEQAQPEEVWELTCSGMPFAASLHGEQWVSANGGEIWASRITAGRRIWPEVSA